MSLPPTPHPFASPSFPPSATPPIPTYPQAPSPTVYLPPSSPHPPPRPRKPYTSTKVREMWTPEEHGRMIEALRLYKRDWAKVTKHVGTRSAAQVRSHAQKHFDRIARDKTDEYVPRPRPKRKSATPYPRKQRDDSVSHPSVQLHPHYRMLPPHSPVLPQHVLHPQMAYQFSSPTHPTVYSPYFANGIPVGANQFGVLGGVYGAPVSHIVAPPPPMYGMLSPLSPAIVSSVTPRSDIQSSTPAHQLANTVRPVCSAHRNGPTRNSPVGHVHGNGDSSNCAKCAALRRHGGVLNEIDQYRRQQPPRNAEVLHTAGAARFRARRVRMLKEKRGRKRARSAEGSEQSTESLSSSRTHAQQAGRKVPRIDLPPPGNATTVTSAGGSGSTDNDTSSSPKVQSYSPKERKEIYDAVQSLQILSKTSSSGTDSDKSKSEEDTK